jgi:hypothetical protein
MKLSRTLTVVLVFLMMAILAACGSSPAPTPTATVPPLIDVTVPGGGTVEQPVTEIPLTGPVTPPEAEISGMSWYGDYLILLPQFPNRVATEGEGAVFALFKEDIVAYLDEPVEDVVLQPLEIPFVAPGLEEAVPGFDGFEAIAFTQGQVFLLIEARDLQQTKGYLVAGEVASDLSEIRVDVSTLVEIPSQSGISNMSDETLVVTGELLVTIHEASGMGVNPEPVAHLFDQELESLGTLGFPNIEYRITDATRVNTNGRFWAINYFWPGDTELAPDSDPLAERFGEGSSHAQSDVVERLVEFKTVPAGFELTDTPPIQLELLEGDEARNWEGVALLDARGFLLVTDEHPRTILAFVPRP